MASRETVTLKEYTDALLAERDKRHTQRDHFLERSIDTALVSLNKRLDLLNELRGNVATREQMDAVGLRVSDMKSTLDIIAGTSTGKAQSWAVLIASIVAVGALCGIAGFFLSQS